MLIQKADNSDVFTDDSLILLLCKYINNSISQIDLV